MTKLRRTFGCITVVSVAALAAACGGGEPPALAEAEQAVGGASCSAPTFSATKISENQAALSARSSCGTAGVASYRFMAKAPGATAYTLLRDWSVEGDFTWSLPVSPSGRYALLVWVRPEGATLDYDASASASVNVGSSCTPTRLDTTVAADGSIAAAATATCTGLAKPEYRFFARAPGATSFKEVRPYFTDAAAVVPIQASGRYEVLVHTRAAGNASDYEGYLTASARVQPACTSATLTATTDGFLGVSLAATAACGTPISTVTPEYRFLVRAPGAASFVEFLPYGPTAGTAFVAPAPGRYEFQVWARAKGNASDWEALATTSALAGPTCTSATLTTAFVAADAVNLSATAACGKSPAEYRFLVRRPGATAFVEVRPWDPDPAAGYLLPVPTPGRWEFRVEARVQGNASTYEAIATASALAGDTCSAATLAATADANSNVSLSASSTCAATGTAEYRFLVRPPGAASFSEIRPYLKEGTFAYQAGSGSGRYEFQVQARVAGNASDWEAIAASSALVGPSCAFAGLSAAYDASTTEVRLTASATCATYGSVVRSPEYRFLVRPPGQTAFAELRAYGPGATLVWPVYPAVPGRFEFKVYVREEGNASDWEAAATASALVGPSCTSATVSGAYDGVSRAAFTASASCGFEIVPEFRFLIRGPGATVFSEARAWSPDPRYDHLFPSPQTPGRYEVQVQARLPGSRSEYEAAATTSLLVGPTCSSASLAASPTQRGPSPAPPVTLAANAVCAPGTTPQYRFLVRRPGEPSFSTLVAWTSAGTVQVDPGVWLSGRFEFQVQVRAAGDASDYEAIGSASMFLGPACSAAALATSPDGQGVRLTANATCTWDAAPEFRFLVKGPGESGYAELRSWGAPFYGFTPLAPGRYELQVQVRAQGNASAYEAAATSSAFFGATCQAASITATVRSATEVSLAAASSCTTDPYSSSYPEYRYQAKGPGDTGFVDIRGWSMDGTTFFPAPPDRTGRWEFQVLVRASGNRSEWEAIARTSVLLGPTCSAATLAVTPGTDIVDLAAGATCPYVTPEYRFLVKRPGESAFSELRPYGTDAHFAFFTALLPAGRYEFQVQARTRGNASDSEATATASWLVGAACSASALAAAQNGGNVELAASASCRFGKPEYRFLARRPGTSSFLEIAPWSWSPRPQPYWWDDGRSQGRWEFQVAVRLQGNVGEESSATTSALLGATCPGASIAVNPAGGWPVVVASAACQQGASAQYRFLVKPPGGAAFAEFRPYGPDPSAPLAPFPPGPGRYEVQVQVRAAGNASDYEAQATTSAMGEPVCRTVTLTAVRDASGWVDLQASPACASGDPEVRFLYRRAGAASFVELKPYDRTASYPWWTGQLAPGTYEVQAQARVLGNPSSWEAVATMPVDVEAPPAP